MSIMKKIALIVQRYGIEVNGGAEYHCRKLAEKLNPIFEVEVLTSCAKDYFTWANEYPEGLSKINEVRIRRFAVPYTRNKKKVHRLVNKLTKNSFPEKLLRFFGLLNIVERKFDFNGNLEATGDEWSKQQGPFVPDLITYLKDYQSNYDALIFFTYLYFPTFFGLRVAPQKSILIPTAHDEPPIHFPIFQPFFKLPKAILYNTYAEKKLVNRLFDNADIYSDVVGLGLDEVVPETGLSSFNILGNNDPYLIYIGRIDPGKGSDLMFEYFLKYKNLTKDRVKLVLIGKSYMDIPAHNDIVSLGFVDESIKQTLLAGAKALIMPSHYESLSLVTLESMQAGIPVIANEFCEVLKDHVENSQAGFTYNDFNGFKTAVAAALGDHTKLDIMKKKAGRYINENYSWEVVLTKLTKAINFVSR
jgi:glycosyltransferase involved in cell wall biosynthesis